MPTLSGAAPSAGTRAARDESLTAAPGRIHGVAVWWKCDSDIGLAFMALVALRTANADADPQSRPDKTRATSNIPVAFMRAA